MKRSEAIERYHDAIADVMTDRYRKVLESGGRIQYKVYVWEDGEIECLLGYQGDNTYLKPYDTEPRELFYVATVGGSYFDPWDCAGHSAPDDEAEREAEEAEIIDWAMESCEQIISELIDEAISDAKSEEQYDAI